MKTQYITTRFPSDLADRLKDEAKRTERSAGAVIRLAVAAYLERVKISDQSENKP